MKRPPRGYTLMEMLVTMGIVVLVAGMSWPALRGPLANHQLREAAQRIRIELAKTRLEAMETARPYELRYYGGSPWFLVTAEPVVEHDGMTTGPLGSSRRADLDQEVRVMLRLPGDVRFVDEAAPESVLHDYAQEAPPEDDPLWSAPIRFQPDGTTASTALALANGEGNRVVVTLRGLTGTVAVGSLVKNDNLAR